MKNASQSFVVYAPTRADLAGGTVDLWPLYTFFDHGKTINVALDLRAKVSFSAAPSDKNNISIEGMNKEVASFSNPLDVESLKILPSSCQFPAHIVSCFLRDFDVDPVQLSIKFESEAPPRSGLGGSSTLCVALTRGLGRIFNQFTNEIWRWEMLHWVKDVEAGFLKVPTGTQDYLAALFGSANSFESRHGVIKQNPYSEKVVSELSERMIILYSGEMHHSGLSNWEVYKGAIEGKQGIISGFQKINAIATEMDRLLRGKSISWKDVGKLISDEWSVRRDTFQVNTPTLDEIVDFVSKQNILGVKVCGAAAGGCLLTLVEPENRKTVSDACARKGIKVLKTDPYLQGVHVEKS